MDRVLIRLSAISYILAVITLVSLSLVVPTYEYAETVNYINWWNSVPLTDLQYALNRIAMTILLMSFISAVLLLTLKRWAVISFLGCSFCLILIDLKSPHYYPLSVVEATIESVASYSIACVFTVFLLSDKLDTFRNKV